MSSIRKIYNTIIPHLPKKYRTPIRICNSNTHLMREWLCLYGEIINDDKITLAKKEYKNQVQSYKYKQQQYRPLIRLFRYTKKKEKSRGTVCAIATNPILINRRKFRNDHDINVAILILHEIGHLYFRNRYGVDSDELYANKFAYRWIKRLIKQGVIKQGQYIRERKKV